MPNETGVNMWDEAIDGLSGAIDNLNKVVPEDLELSSFANEMQGVSLRINCPVVMAQVIMQNLDYAVGNADSFDECEKQFWMKVGFELGADWIAKFRRIGAFMSAVEKA